MKVQEKRMYRLKVKEVAQQKGISQRQLFLRSGVDIRTIRRIFQHPDAVVTVETLAKLAKVLEVDVSELIESIPDKSGTDTETT
jgi:DNA-binding Xre family transcriptional regulator